MKQFIFLILFSILTFGMCLNAHSQNLKESFKAVASDQTAQDKLGTSVGITEDYAIAGAPNQDKDTAGLNFLTNAGAAYIYEKDGSGNWFQQQKLVPSARDTNDFFGHSVAISGEYAVVGAYAADEDALGLNPKIDAGAVYVFKRNSAGSWQEVSKLTALDRAAGDYFGFSVAISGNTIIVGAHQEDEDTSNTATFSNAGSVYVFALDSAENWNQVQKIVSNDRDAEDFFGYAIAFDGNTILAGAHQDEHDVNGSSPMFSAGSAYIFSKNSSGLWIQNQKITSSIRNTFYFFGRSVAIQNDRIVIGAPYDSWDTVISIQVFRAGAFFTFEKGVNGVWVETQKIVSYQRVSNDYFGYAVAIYGDYLLVTASREDNDAFDVTSEPQSGSAYLYKRAANSRWNLTQKLKGSNFGPLDEMGSSAAMFKNTIVVGAPYNDFNKNVSITTDEGTAYIFQPCDTAVALNIAACDSFVSPSGNYTWYTNGQYQDTVIYGISTNCNTYYTINLSIGSPERDTLIVSTCDSYTSLSGKFTYSSSATFLDTVTTVSNCDSILLINLTILNSTSAQINAVACSSYTSPSGRYTWQTNGTFQDTLFAGNNVGCDSILTINLSIEQTFSTITISECNSYTSPSGRYTWSAPGVYMDTLINGNSRNCDSIITINLSIDTSSSLLTTIACKSFASPSGRYVWNTSGVYADTLLGGNSKGCDSLLTIDLTIKTVDTSLSVFSPNINANAFGAVYQWLDCNNNFAPIVGENNQSFIATNSGSYAVEISANGCTDTSRCVQIVGVGVKELKQQSYAIAPNPSKGITYLRKTDNSPLEITVTSIEGQLIMQNRWNDSGIFPIDLSNESNGIYLIKIATGNTVELMKLVKY